MGQIGLPCTPPPPQDSLRPSFFCSLDLPRYQKLGWTTCFDPFSKWPPSKSGNNVFCHNLSSNALRVTKLVSMHMFLGVWNSIMPIKMFLSCGKFINSCSNVFFVHFRSFFVLVHGTERVTVHPPPMKVRDQVFFAQ